MHAERLRRPIFERLRAQFPQWEGVELCREDLQHARLELLREATEMPREVVGKLDPKVLARMTKRELISAKVDSNT